MSAFALLGTGVSEGIAIGRALVLTKPSFDSSAKHISKEAIPEEAARLEQALARTRASLAAALKQIPQDAREELLAFVKTHLFLLEDAQIAEVPKQIIARDLVQAEWALKTQLDHLLRRFDDIEEPYLRERRQDLIQVMELVLKNLRGDGDPVSGAPILVAHDLSPGEVITWKSQGLEAFVLDAGGGTSHSAIVIKGLMVPGVVGMRTAHELIEDGDTVVVDGGEGVVMVNPGPQTLAEYRLRTSAVLLEKQRRRRIRGTRAMTLDGVEVGLFANLEFPQDAVLAKSLGAAGVGLFRSEFLFLGRKTMPGEEEQYLAYREVVQQMAPKPVTIRTLDLGAEKTTRALSGASTTALGLRAIRLCLAETALFMQQLRSVLRASASGKVRLLLPLVTSVSQVEESLALIRQAKEELRQEKVAFDEDIEVGVMIEVPATALMADVFAKYADFLSLGTNDLVQYTLAADRSDDRVEHLADPAHPAVLKLLAKSVSSARRQKTPISICGEMAGDVEFTRLLLALGFTELSMQPAAILTVKERLLHTDTREAKRFLPNILRARSAEEARHFLDWLNHV